MVAVRARDPCRLARHSSQAARQVKLASFQALACIATVSGHVEQCELEVHRGRWRAVRAGRGFARAGVLGGFG